MGLRSTAGTLRAFPTLGRRSFLSEQRMDALERRVDLLGGELGEMRHGLADHATAITELMRRSTAVEHLLEQLHREVAAAAPQATLGIVESVRDHVATLSIELAEQMNRTSALLAGAESIPATAPDDTATADTEPAVGLA